MLYSIAQLPIQHKPFNNFLCLYNMCINMVESVQLATLYHLRTFITIYATEEPFIGWPLSGVVYFNILRIYIITGLFSVKALVHYHETFWFISFTIYFTLCLKHSSFSFFHFIRLIKINTVTGYRTIKKSKAAVNISKLASFGFFYSSRI